jgi:hypothetical protein
MTFVEQIYPGFQWAEPLKGSEFEVKQIGLVLEVSGFFPTYGRPEATFDLIRQYDKFSQTLAKAGQISGALSPEISFANADTDEKLIAFVRQFGPVVTKRLKDTRIIPDAKTGEPESPGRLIAQQDMQELKSEQSVYRAALGLVHWLANEGDDTRSVDPLIELIAVRIKDWPEQWMREKRLREKEPAWQLREKSLKRIEGVARLRRVPDWQAALDVRIIICELLNSFPSTVYSNPLELHDDIKFGVRPLLYSLLRRQFLYPRGFSICLNTECRNFFSIERAGQQFCNADCSIRQRQRDYWQERGKKMREKRTAKRKRLKK